MYVKYRFAVLAIAAILLLGVAGHAIAQETPGSPEVGACQPGVGYTSGCDVDQDGDIDIFDIQLTAGRWNSSGVYTSSHTHWGETWTGAGAGDGLRVENAAASGYAYGVTGQSASTNGRGVYGYVSAASGATYGVQGQSASTGGSGVYGLATASSGAAYGVYGESASTGGRGVYGVATAASGDTIGVYGRSLSTGGYAGYFTGQGPDAVFVENTGSGRGLTVQALADTAIWAVTDAGIAGVDGRASSSTGRGVYGYATATSGANSGVYGRSKSSDGRGVYGWAEAISGVNYGVYGEAWSTSGRGVYGIASASTGTTYGVLGKTSSVAGHGVKGWAEATTGTNYGVVGQSDSINGFGLYGGATASGSGASVGVYGISYTTGGNGGRFEGYGQNAVYVRNLGTGRGVRVETSADTAIYATTTSGTGIDSRSDFSTGRGVLGWATAATGQNYGVYGRSSSSEGYGVYGSAETATGINYGVYGRSLSSGGRGVYGLAEATTGLNYGVLGRTDSTNGIGVYGFASASTGTTYGVYGTTSSAAGYAGYFSGRVEVTGNLSKGGGSFKIDHPLDPANQYLYHSFVESPDMMNIYNGNVTLDDQGEARVEMPDWFEALNQDFRYQLTPIGGWAPLYIAQEIEGNAFRIAGGEPGMKVSWMVTGIRHDAYAEAHRIPVEEPKPAGERGLYLHPAELGQPAELGLDYQRTLDPAE